MVLSRRAGEDVGSYEISADVTAPSYYLVQPRAASFTIAPRPVSVSVQTASKFYGQADPQLSFTVNGAGVDGSLGLVGNDRLVLGRVAGENAGSYALDASNVANRNYAVTANNMALTINPRPITVTAQSASKVYGEADPALTYSVGLGAGLTGPAILPGDVLNGSLSRAPGVNVGSYAISAGGLSNPNYAITPVAGVLEVTPRPLTIAVDAQSKVYGDADPTLTYAVLRRGQQGSLGLVAGDVLAGGLSREAGSNVGSYKITGAAIVAANTNYRITSVDSALTVRPRPITVTGDTLATVYGDAEPLLPDTVAAGGRGTSRGLVAGDSLSGSLTREAGNGLGRYQVSLSGLSNPNYEITAVAGSLSVSARPITVRADSLNKVYGEADPQLTYRVDADGVGTSRGLVSGDSLSGSLTRDGATRTRGNDVGSYTIDASDLSNPNYRITRVNGTLTIDPRAITVTADSLSKVYGDRDPELTYSVGLTSGGSGPGLLPGDTLSGSLSRVAGSNVGSYAIAASGLRNRNYVVTAVDGALQITPRPVTVVADTKVTVYGQADPQLTYTVAADGVGTSRGLVGGDTLQVALSRQAGGDAGSYDITAAVSANPNYVVTAPTGTFRIDPRPVSLAVTTQSKMYGETDPGMVYTVNPAGVGGSLGILPGESLVIGRAIGEGAGVYEADATNPANRNYRITVDNPLLRITPRPITVTVDAKSKFYGDPDPALTYAVVADNGTTSRGLLQGDTLTGGLTRAAGNAAGSYAISTAGLTNPNYAITSTGGLLTINPRPVTVVADAKTKVFGEADPQLTYVILPNGSGMSRGLVTGDQLAVSLSRTPGMDVGNYPILSTVAPNPNYLVTANNATFSITPRPVRVGAEDATRTFGEDNPDFVYTIERGATGTGRGLLHDDSTTGQLSTLADKSSPPGIYSITLGTLTPPSTNYSLELTGAKLSIARIESPLPINKSLNQSLGPKEGAAAQSIPVIAGAPALDTSSATAGVSLNGGLAFVEVQQTSSAGIAMTPIGSSGPQTSTLGGSGSTQEDAPIRVQVPETKLLGYSTVLVVNGGIALPTQTTLIGE